MSATLRQLTTADLTPADVAEIRALITAAFGTDEGERFTDDDWEHAVGGTHFMLDLDGDVIVHASIVERAIQIGDTSLRTGYVEAVATAPEQQGHGLGTIVMEAVTAEIRASFELGMLGTGRQRFYERLGWETWTGPAFVRTAEGPRRTPDEEGFLLVLRTPASPAFTLDQPISCDWRVGDVW